MSKRKIKHTKFFLVYLLFFFATFSFQKIIVESPLNLYGSRYSKLHEAHPKNKALIKSIFFVCVCACVCVDLFMIVNVFPKRNMHRFFKIVCGVDILLK